MSWSLNTLYKLVKIDSGSIENLLVYDQTIPTDYSTNEIRQVLNTINTSNYMH
jgi:hypothetical protein